MRKSLFAIGLLAVSYSVQAQNVLCHVDTNANMYVSEGTLVYSGGGVQTKGNGILDVHGNVMIVGTAGDALRTLTDAGGEKTDGGNIVLRLNNPGGYATSTYGQLYIDGLNQSDITGFVSKEYRDKKHGNGNFYQQMALPFYNKTISTLSSEFGKTFTSVRRSGNDILKQDDQASVARHYGGLYTSATSDPSGYYMLGSLNNNLDPSTPPATFATIAPTPAGSVYTLSGRPYATFGGVQLQNSGLNGFGPGGTALNYYGEKFNTYLQDQFDTNPWVGNYGKNIYQFGNPFFTNLDISKIGYVENGGVTDGNNIPNIMGVRYDPGTVIRTPQGNTYSTNALYTTFDPATGIPVGDQGMIIKPMQTFVLKLRNNDSQTLNFNTLRRFKETVRAAGTDYDVTAARYNGNTNRGSVKQLGVIGLDANQNEITRTYYVVSPNASTGHQSSMDTTVQVKAVGGANSENLIGTFEENPNGGIDTNYSAQYWLYINEANEADFLGKNVKLVNYNTDKVKFYKFEIRENAELISNGAHQLSSGTGFYYKAANGTVQQAKQGDVIPSVSASYDLYYGQPNSGTLAVKDDKKIPSRTMVVYNPEITNYIVRFDPEWKKADIEVYDMSGKLVISKKAVDASRDFVIELNSAIKNSYVVKIVSDKGETVNTKILK
ncbi:MAG: T9SS type A sorting domain-containing protein [Chryseobacterium sp.]|jgi:hypothetical protein|uniref:T9SS type A sorting domain-containing protein n=1 Tax=Chryseobacterium sp. TaxID=1871047 RepID=UPI00282AA721|nr:T9SS type A sorting domain-containing protein [Chryseobacterium sp.]MDR2237179.1 T9SS type A sorting domain-containing protein [Chryseobacterium sp.]